MSVSFQYALLGGLLIGISASLLMFILGKISGLSGIFANLIKYPQENWRWNFISGFFLGAVLIRFVFPEFVQISKLNTITLWTVIAGVLVGIGTQMSGGCTSGHGVCGISRLSKRSIVATILFMGSAMIVVWVRGHL